MGPLLIDSSGIEITMKAKRDDKKVINGFITTIHVPEEIPEKPHGVLKKVVSQCAVKKTIMNNPDFIVETIKR